MNQYVRLSTALLGNLGFSPIEMTKLKFITFLSYMILDV
jgi:hypothetical protein